VQSRCQSVPLFALQVFKGITDGELDVLDIFEDEEYVRETVGISLTVSHSTQTSLLKYKLLAS
jgi:hypothetical protein